MRSTRILLVLGLCMMFTACTENYSNGERIGMVTRFSRKGMWWKSWEGNLNLTQTGMNSSGEPFDFSIDNDHEDAHIVAMIDSAANQGWKVKLTYHETFGKNWFNNRGGSSHFISSVDVLDRNPVGFLRGSQTQSVEAAASGKTIDTVYVVIVGKASEGYKPPK